MESSENTKQPLPEKLRELFKLKFRFAMTSAIATVIDYALYMVFVTWFFDPVISNILSYSIAVIINFSLQKKYIFDLQRKVKTAFILSVLVSLGGLLLSTGFIYFLTREHFFMDYQIITKLVATSLVFFYNFYLKRFVFERKFI